MDYDDNDFQGQNLQLAGEGSSKFSPVLRPYALPKFDFDDSLQGHLRFDSLVENEVFLGIPSQEDSQWIEDFSRGSSGIEFSSSAADSCSISRRNNVWSEATSSESVEMLLKSVGQGEMVPGETIIEESEAGNELGSLTKQMEHNSKQDDRMEDVIDPQPALPPDEFRESFSGLNESAEGECPRTKCTSQSQEAELSSFAHASSSELDPNAVSEKRSSIITSENLDIDRKCDDPNQREVDTSVYGSLNNKIQEPPVYGTQIGSMNSSLQNVISSVRELNDQEIPHQVSDSGFENANKLSEDICKGGEEYNIEILKIKTDDQMLSGTAVETCAYNVDSPHCVSSKMESVKKHAVETGTSKFEQMSSLPLKGDCDVQIAEGSSQEVFSVIPSSGNKCQVFDFSKGTEINEQVEDYAYEESPIAFQGDASFEGHAIEVGSTKEGSFSHQELKMGSPMQITHGQCSSIEENDSFLASDSQMDRGASANSSEEYILSGVDNEPFKQGDEGRMNHVGELANTVGCSSAELLGKKHTSDNIKDGNDAPVVQEDSNVEDHCSPPMLVGSMQMCKINLLPEQGNVSNFDQVVSLTEKGKAKLPTDSSETECEVGSLDSDKRDVSSSFDEGVEENVVIAPRSEFDTTTANKPELDVGVRNTNIASCDTLDDFLSLSGSVTTDEVIDHKEEQKSPAFELGFMHRDKQDGTEIEVPIDTSLSTLKESSQVASELGLISEVDKVASGDCAAEKLHEMVDQSVPIVETCNASDRSEQAAVANEVGQECFEKLEVTPVLCDLTVKEGDGAEAVDLENLTETTGERSYEVISVEVADAVPVPNKGEVLTEPTSVEVADAVPVPNKGEVLTEPTSVSLVETTMASGVNNSGQVSPNTKVDTSNDRQASLDPVCSSERDDIRVGGNSADSDKPNCDSPIVISCIDLSNSDRDKQKGAKGAMGEVVPLSEGTDGVDGKFQSISLPSSGNDVSKEERSFTFEVSPLLVLSEGETGKGWQSFPTIQACKILTIAEGSPSTTVGNQMDPKIAQKISLGSPQASDGGITSGGSKGTPERKTRRGSGKAAGKENAKKGSHVKETTPVRPSERGDKSGGPMSPLGTGPLVQYEELKPYGNVEGSGAKPYGVISIPTANLPDLNTSVPQPFTDIQQVQLRAQIFVYGSLIQGAAPEEACMVAAFGQSDGARSVWEPAWRACLERLHDQKSYGNNSESPGQSRSGTRTPDQAIKHGSLQSKGLSSPVGRVSSKGTPSSVVNPMIPLSSPLWNVSTPSSDGLKAGPLPRSPLIDYHQALPPLNPYQSPMQRFVGHSPSWLSQASFPGPWVASPQTTSFDVSGRFSRFPITEAVKLTPVKESSVPISSSTKNVSPIPVAHSGGPSVFAGTTSLLDAKKVTSSPGQHSADPKTRKRKKGPFTEDLGQISLPAQTQTEAVSAHVVSSHLSKKAPVTEDLGQISLLAQSKTESVSAPVVSSHFSTSVVVTSSTCVASKSNSGKFLSAVSPTSSIDHPNRGDQNAEKFIISEDPFGKVEEAKLQAEDAATHAAAAVSHCQGVWSQLDKQKISGLDSDVEAKLASAAVAIAAAASVAKAAAAAAKIASNVAVQAKLMADEALVSSGTGNPAQSTTNYLPDIVNNLGKATPATILKGGDGSKCSSSIIVAAREAARKRVEAASAASKHAENLDALVKAAELAAEAVSQAGKIVSMGDPLPLSELVDFGPDGYWRGPHVPSEQGGKSNNVNRDQSNTISVEVPNVSTKQPIEGPFDKEMHNMNSGILPLPKVISRDLKEDYLGVVDGISGSVTSIENDSRVEKGHRVSDLAKTIGVVPESEFGSRSTSVIGQDEYHNAIGSSKENSINTGCLVEVYKDGGNCKAAWFPAKVLDLTDGKAFVCYTELQSDDGSGKLKEWVPLEDKGNKAPGIRIAHPMTTMHFEGMRKRRRTAMTDYVWSIGDRVDAWIQDSWREGVVSEKNQKDGTTLTVNFPVEGETSVVKAWNLRPTLVWKDGEWIEWSSSRGDRISQGDTPQEKRLKLGSPAIEGKGKDKVSKNINLVESGKQEESRVLHLSASEKVFNVGQNTRGENRLEAHRTMRAGLQKEGSGVIYGVPKPKRKFMEVSKHYTSERSSKSNSANDSVKFARFLMPQASRWKNSSKVDAKEKAAAVSKPQVPKSGKPQIASGRTLSQKDNLLIPAKSAPDATISDRIVKESISNDENESGRQKLMESGSSTYTEKAARGPLLFSSRGLAPDAPSKKVPLSNAKSERVDRGKLAPDGGKSTKGEVKDKSIPEVVEPRRSNRRIQPTSRLLEGLQTSLIVSKIPAISHDKSHKSQNRGTPRGNNSHG